MPGLKKSPGVADIDVCYGAHQAGTEGVQSAMQRARWKYEQAPLEKAGSLDLKRYSDLVSDQDYENSPAESVKKARPSSFPVHDDVENPASSIPQLHPNEEPLILEQPDELVSPLENGFDAEAAVDGPVSPPSVHEESGDIAILPTASVPRDTFDPEDSRLPPTPPTPPTLSNGNAAALKNDESSSALPSSSEDVKSIITSMQNGQPMTPVNQLASPPTPDPSPPRARDEHSELPPMEQKTQLLPVEPSNPGDYGQFTGSLEDSFSMDQPAQLLKSDDLASPVHLPENDVLPEHWLDSSRELKLASIGLDDNMVIQTPDVKLADPQTPNATSLQRDRQQRGFIPARRQEKGSGETARSLSQDAEDRNNLIYKRLQQERIARHSAVSAKSGAITVGISVPSIEMTPRTLKRRAKRSSLRGDSSVDSKTENSTGNERRAFSSGAINTNRGLGIHREPTTMNDSRGTDRALNIHAGRTLKQRKARQLDKTSLLSESPLFGRSTLDDSPIFEPNIRQVSSPARLGTDASDMTALTLASMQDSPSANRASKFTFDPPHKLRHVSHEDRLSRNPDVRRTSLEASPPQRDASLPLRLRDTATKNTAIKRNDAGTLPTQSPEQRSPGSTLRRFSRDERLENNASVRRTSLDHASPLTPRAEVISPSDKLASMSSPRRSMDARFLHPTTTPMSIFSDRTENIEIGEANGVRLYPHNNDSLHVIQHFSGTPSNDKDASEAPNFYATSLLTKPIFKARVEPPTPTSAMARLANHIDSPLTNPRLAPEPPLFHVIPPTPDRELENLHLGPFAPPTTASNVEPKSGPKRLSLVQKARRYSDTMFPNLATLRKSRNSHFTDSRATHLSPLWRPQGFWDDFDSEDEFNDFEPAGSLPRGGDTSDVAASEVQKRGLFPRAMSKRLPGFRGSGGFLQGNSLGIDRHGTNSRRHYVSSGTRTLSKQQSEDVIRNLSGASSGRVSPEHPRVVRTRGVAYWLGTRKLRTKMRTRRLAKEEREREMRREKLRKSIQRPSNEMD